jgi:cytochrome c oxidase cbb3-type subunit 1
MVIRDRDGPVGRVGFLAGRLIAWQLAFPVSTSTGPNRLNFGRLRPAAHLGGDLRLWRQRADRDLVLHGAAHLGGAAVGRQRSAWFVFWGYQLFIVLAATGYLLGATQSKEYAEPEWYVDLWLTLVWVVYLAIFLGTLMKRKEPHIYVANWFYLSFIVTVAMLHVVNNLRSRCRSGARNRCRCSRACRMR